MTRLNRSITSFFGIGVLALAVSSVQAQPVQTYPGYRNNAMTKKEGKKVAKRRRHLDRVRQRAYRDGYVTRKEAKKINKAQRKLAHRGGAPYGYANSQYPWGQQDWRNSGSSGRFDNRGNNGYGQYGWNGNRGSRRGYAQGDQDADDGWNGNGGYTQGDQQGWNGNRWSGRGYNQGGQYGWNGNGARRPWYNAQGDRYGWNGNRGPHARYNAQGDQRGWYDSRDHQRRHDHHDRYSMRDRQRPY